MRAKTFFAMKTDAISNELLRLGRKKYLGRFMQFDGENTAYTITYIGDRMEDQLEVIKSIAEQIKSQKDILQESYNEVVSLSNQFLPLMKLHLEEVRDNRMAQVREINETLKLHKEIRQFFLEKDYEAEKMRLAEFIGLCERLKVLKDDGTLDAVAETIIKLQEGGEHVKR
jgi:hypothetical protein